MKKKHIDLSHTIVEGEITYKGLPAPIIQDYLSRKDSKAYYEGGTSFQIGKIEMIANTGTYIDFPFHRYEHGKDISNIPLHKLVGIDGVLINAPYNEGIEIGEDYFNGLDLINKAVLINTGWSSHWQTDQYFENHPYLTESAAMFLKELNVQLVGIDSYNIDDTSDKTRPVHSIFLKHDIPIVEHLTNLAELKNHSFTFSAIPPKVKGLGSFPVRAFATIL